MKTRKKKMRPEIAEASRRILDSARYYSCEARRSRAQWRATGSDLEWSEWRRCQWISRTYTDALRIMLYEAGHIASRHRRRHRR